MKHVLHWRLQFSQEAEIMSTLSTLLVRARFGGSYALCKGRTGRFPIQYSSTIQYQALVSTARA